MSEAVLDLGGTTAIITGAASGIGKNCAFLLSQLGASVVVADIASDAGRRTAEEILDHGGRAKFVLTDVTDGAHVEGLFLEAATAFGSVDALVHCAGVMSTTPVMEIGMQEWERVMRINLGATFFCAREALRYMCRQGSGRIVTISSSAGKTGGLAVGAHYAASKAGVICLTKTLAQFAAPYHVLVNSVCPGSTRTPMAAAWSPEIQEALKAKIPLGRLAEAHEVAGAVCFLLSPLADFITGEILDVNGGMVMD